MAKKVNFKLNHACRMPGCEGQPGEVISISADMAEHLLERGGGEVVASAPVLEKATSKAAAKAENAAKRT